MEIHCYCCGLELGDHTAEIETAAHLLDAASQESLRHLLTRTSFEAIPPTSFCTFCLTSILGFDGLFDPQKVVSHARFDVRTTIGAHSTTAEWATCVDCGVTLRERASQTSGLVPPSVRLRRRMLLHAAGMRYGHTGFTRVMSDRLDHRDGA